MCFKSLCVINILAKSKTLVKFLNENSLFLFLTNFDAQLSNN